MNTQRKLLGFATGFFALNACGGGWTKEAALQPHLVRLDADGNGRVEAQEYESLRRVGPPFAQVDHDRDGAINTDELAFLLRFQDPTGFDHVEIDADLRPASFGAIRLGAFCQHRG